MVINTNIAATAASRTLGESAKALSASLTRLSSGSKIVSPEDDAAGLAARPRQADRALCQEDEGGGQPCFLKIRVFTAVTL